MAYYARSEGVLGEKQLLHDHLQNVAIRTGEFAEAACLPRDLGEWAGWLHDLGKYSDEFQSHLESGDRKFVEHAAHGALIAVKAKAVECAFAVNGHHAGLGTRAVLKELTSRDEKTAGLVPSQKVVERTSSLRKRAHSDGSLVDLPQSSTTPRGAELQLELRTRMLLSCLADADRLDAEAWKSQFHPYLRTTIEPLNAAARLASVREFIANLGEGRQPSDIAQARADVLSAALAAGPSSPGFFSLTVPTGGGKTLASLAFALAHAQKYGMRRIIFVVPFLTVIEQNADVIRRAVGGTVSSNVVLEHHSNLLPVEGEHPEGQADHDVRQRLLAENWDAPIIITTAVQFFESLFSDHPTRVRKIHNVASSVIVFDEAQTFPPGMLRPLVAMLRQLVDEYRCTAMFCTATQPALTNDIRGSDGPAPLLPTGSVREIAPDPVGLFERLKRVRLAWSIEESTPPSGIAESMAMAGKALAVVNTKKQARDLYNALLARNARAIHLSTRMCAAHRRKVVAEIRHRLLTEESCLVASTQLVEAGVDVDFPAVWRALGPLDSIAQAAGRCNREGNLPTLGTVTVFRPEGNNMPAGVYRQATEVTEVILRTEGGSIDIHTPESFAAYFVKLYNTTDLDQERVEQARRALDFPEVAHRFKLIDDITTGVLVPYEEGAEWVSRLGNGEPFGRGQLRQMQPFMVALYERELDKAMDSGVVTVEGDGIHVFHGEYSDALGLTLPGDDPLID